MTYWRCINCNKELNSLGMARHRAMHRDKKEYCQMMDSEGNIHRYHYDSKLPVVKEKE